MLDPKQETYDSQAIGLNFPFVPYSSEAILDPALTRTR